MVKRIVFLTALVFAITVVAFAQDDDSPQDGENKSAVVEAAKEAWGLYVQYKRLTKEISNCWEDEIKQGLQEGRYIDVSRTSRYSTIKDIFERLLDSPHLKKERQKYKWRLYVQNTDAVNAFATLDGIIVINRGIIDFCNDDDELAIVIGHEIAHMTENHVKKQLGAKVVKEPIIEHVSAFIAKKKNKRLNMEEITDKEISDREMFRLIFGLAGELTLLKYSRSQEEKADEEGAKFAASVGYDTDKGYNLWKRMAKLSSNRWLSFLNTHPASNHRAKAFLNGNYNRKYYKDYP